MADPNNKNKKPIVTIPSQSQQESVISMVLGGLVVLVIGALLFSYIRDWRKVSQNAETEASPSPTPLMVEELPSTVETETNGEGQVVPKNLPAKYTVKEGDSTWKIAEAFYGSGFNYVDIEKENSLSPEQGLKAGMELNIPQTPVRTAQDAARVSGEYTESAGTSDPSQAGPEKGDDSAAQAVME